MLVSVLTNVMELFLCLRCRHVNAGSIMVSVRGIIVPLSFRSNTIVDVSVVALSSNDTNGRLLS